MPHSTDNFAVLTGGGLKCSILIIKRVYGVLKIYRKYVWMWL